MTDEKRPAHHVEMLGIFEQAAEAAELFSRLADFAGTICLHIGIEDAQTVLSVVQEQAKRRARRQLAKMITEQLQPPVLEAIFPEPAPDPISAVFSGLRDADESI